MDRADFEQWKPKEVARLLALVEKSRRYYQDLVAALPVPLVVLSEDRSVVFANRAFLEKFELRVESVGGMPIDQILPSERLVERIRDVHVRGITQQGFALQVGDKALRIAIVPLRNPDDGMERETLLVVEEVSGRSPEGVEGAPAAPRTEPGKQAEQQELTAARNKALQGLSAQLAHDLNNPLMIITGYAEELLAGLKPNDPQRGNVQQILEATERIAALTSQLLEFTRKQAKPPRPVDLTGVFERLVEDLDVAVDVRRGQPVWALADAGQVEEIVSVLVDAVCEGAAAAQATIVCDTVADPAALRPGSYARLVVSGNGRGFDAEKRAAVFEAFVEKDPEKTIGPALARVYSIARDWGGDIAVSGGPEGGIVFTLYLPAAEPPKTALRPQAVPQTIPQPAQKTRETILVVDDEANIRVLVAKILRREGYHVLQASRSEEAFAVASAHREPIHLLITDVVLPGESGRQIAEKMRKTMPDLKVLYISGFTDDESVRSGQFPPGSKYLQKPFALGALMSKVREALEG